MTRVVTCVRAACGLCLAWLVLALLLALAWRMRGVPGLQRSAQLLLGLCGMQLLTGLSNVVLGWPLLAAVLHTGGASALMVVLVWSLALSRPSTRTTIARSAASGRVPNASSRPVA